MAVDPAHIRRVPLGAPIGAGVLGHGQLARLTGSRFAEVVQFAETTSTNSVLVDMAGHGAPEGLVLVADYQSAGRGRFDRRWESPPGKSLLFSVLLRPGTAELPAGRRHLAVAAVSLALVEAAQAVANVEVQLKWPNDLLAGGSTGGGGKLAGVLAETTPDGAVVVGAGFNVGWAPEAPERAVGAPATCLDALAGRPVQRGELLVSTLLALDRIYGHWDLVSERYRETCATVGRQVTVSFAGHLPDLHGTAVAVDADGRLLVRDGTGGIVAVAAGDVNHTWGPGGPSLSS